MIAAHATATLEIALLAIPAGIVLVSILRSLRARRDPAPAPEPQGGHP